MSEDGVAAILGIRDQIAVMGSNDYEFEAIRQILHDLHDKVITLEEAVFRAKSILLAKQDYH